MAIKTPLLIFALLLLVTGASGEEVFVYTARQEHLVMDLFDAYTLETRTRIRFVTGEEDELLDRLKTEGTRTKADLLITVDAVNLCKAARAGVLSPVSSRILTENIPAHLRDPSNRWFGLSLRARTIVYNTQRVRPETLRSYEALADPAWKGRLLLRTAKKIYNQSLVAMLIAEHGEEKTREILSGWVQNLAVPPFANDTQVLQAVAAGIGDVGIVNTYYFGHLVHQHPELPIKLFWPDQDDGGVHVNISGAGVTAHANNREAAVRFLEWMSSENAQSLIAAKDYEYPVNPRVSPHPDVQAWGSFRQKEINLAHTGAFLQEAIRLMESVGYR